MNASKRSDVSGDVAADQDRVSARWLCAVVAAADGLGLAAAIDGALSQHGLTRTELQSGSPHVKSGIANALLHTGVELSGEQQFGLIAATHVQPQQLDVIEYAARAQPTVGDALEALAKYVPLLHGGLHARVSSTEHELRFSLGTTAARRATLAMQELAFATLALSLRRATDERARIAEAWLPIARPPSGQLHQEIFATRLRFDAPEWALTLRRSDCTLPLSTADADFAGMLDRFASRALPQPLLLLSPADAVRQLLEGRIGGRDSSEAMIARSLSMSVRTLHRRLDAEGTSYRLLCDQVRQNLALGYLADPQLAPEQIATMLGFARLSSFHRAFRRWTGQTITEFRRARSLQLAEAASRVRTG